MVEARADHLSLFFAQVDAALVVDQPTDKIKIWVSNLHDGSRGVILTIGVI
jgi:hypothetical protein